MELVVADEDIALKVDGDILGSVEEGVERWAHGAGNAAGNRVDDPAGLGLGKAGRQCDEDEEFGGGIGGSR